MERDRIEREKKQARERQEAIERQQRLVEKRMRQEQNEMKVRERAAQVLEENKNRIVSNVSEKDWKERRRKENLDKVKDAIRDGREKAKAIKERKEQREREKA